MGFSFRSSAYVRRTEECWKESGTINVSGVVAPCGKAHQATDRRKLAPLVDGRHRVVRGKRNKAVALAIEVRIFAD